jgi:hypothetical protein
MAFSPVPHKSGEGIETTQCAPSMVDIWEKASEEPTDDVYRRDRESKQMDNNKNNKAECNMRLSIEHTSPL